MLLFVVKKFTTYYVILYVVFCVLKLLGKYKLINCMTINYKVEKDNKFKSVSCQVRNDMETALLLNDYKFHKPGK